MAAACNNRIDDDGDGLVDGFDSECTGSLDNDEGSFATGIPATTEIPSGKAVWERDAWRCSYMDAEGRRCSERRYLTNEHCVPFALGGGSGQENLSVLCSAHNQMAARRVFGDAHLERKRIEQWAL